MLAVGGNGCFPGKEVAWKHIWQTVLPSFGSQRMILTKYSLPHLSQRWTPQSQCPILSQWLNYALNILGQLFYVKRYVHTANINKHTNKYFQQEQENVLQLAPYFISQARHILSCEYRTKLKRQIGKELWKPEKWVCGGNVNTQLAETWTHMLGFQRLDSKSPLMNEFVYSHKVAP